VFGYDLRSKRHLVEHFVGPETTQDYVSYSIFSILGLHMHVLPCTLKRRLSSLKQ
jgi:hypothetical protein